MVYLENERQEKLKEKKASIKKLNERRTQMSKAFQKMLNVIIFVTEYNDLGNSTKDVNENSKRTMGEQRRPLNDEKTQERNGGFHKADMS